ncbi:glycosyl hydrolase family 18 protein [Marinicella rhabdoformis]|uniref:glycosyl hydrolase family 18 protein n=1 Tax=Marinicella rhabdoformis TaxID=2580566 RepID=UPI0012AEBDCC|nr:glycosyl hydrolase family 18 protein [Marinicella rhabdoformis]
MYPAVKSFAKLHPSMILTLCYVLITAIGTGYSFFFYREFGINIIKFADLSDFLLAAILEPRSLGLFGFTVVLLMGSYWVDVFFRKRFQFYRSFVENRLKSKYTDPIIMMAVVFLSTVVLMRDLAEENADAIKSQGQDSYKVSYSENGESESLQTLELLGSTSRFVYFYDHERKHAVVVSPENVSYMRKSVLKKEKDKAAQSDVKQAGLDSKMGALKKKPKIQNNKHSPRLIAYYNSNTKPILKNAEQLPYTHYILSFLIPDGQDGIKPSNDLQAVLDDKAALNRVQAAGKKLMVSVGGGTVTGKDWLKMGQHAEAVAESVAAIVEKHNLDGVDLDVEAVPYTKQESFQPYADAVIAITQALSKRLPNKDLSHAPQPPYLCQPGSSGECPNDSLYATILAATGNQISWLNMQYYSNPPVTSSDIDEVESYVSIVEGWEGFSGLDSTRLVLGKPYSKHVNGFEPKAEVNNKILNALIQKYGQDFGGFMAWEYIQDEEGIWAEAVHKSLGKNQVN